MGELDRGWFWTLLAVGVVYAAALVWGGVGRKRRERVNRLLLAPQIAASRLVVRVMHRHAERLEAPDACDAEPRPVERKRVPLDL